MAPKPQTERTINLFHTHTGDVKEDRKKELEHAENIIVSSRYTLWNFLPKSLLEQFRRLANVYFLVIGIIAVIATETSYFETAVEPAGILGPMIVVVLISVIKDGIEDVKRHNQDAKINAQLAHKVSEHDGTIADAQWRELHVGDTIVLFGDEEVPADVVVLACGGVQGPTSYVETAAIDGETNLKMKNPCLVTGLDDPNGDSNDGAHKKEAAKNKKADGGEGLRLNAERTKVVDMQTYLGATITAEVPNGSIHRFNGFLGIPDGSQPANHNHGGMGSSTTRLSHSSGGSLSTVSPGSKSGGSSPTTQSLPVVGQEQRTLTEKNLLLRGSILRATEWAICSVVYTGADTKLSLNSKKTPSKMSSVDRIVNRTMLVAISVMLLVCLISMVFSIVWENDDSNAEYLCLSATDQQEKYPNGGGCESGSTSSVLTIFTFATLYNNFVCISMYVSLELVYLCQSYFLSSDLKLYDPTTDTPAECHTSGMCADLGQVKYVLSDKTGTLTKNLMVVQHFSVADKVFGDPISIPGSDGEPPTLSTGKSGVTGPVRISGRANPTSNNNTTTTDNPLHGNSGKGGNNSPKNSSAQDKKSTTTTANPISNGAGNNSSGKGGAVDPPSSLALLQQMPPAGAASNEENTILESWLRRQFVRVLVYCNTAMLMPDTTGAVAITDLNSLKASLNAESPDEVALIVAAAQHCGALLTSRNGNSIESKGMERYKYSSTPSKGETEPVDGSAGSFTGPTERLELLAVNEFDSDRKMMSVLVRITDIAGPCATNGGSGKGEEAASRIFLLCKGADSSVLKNCLRNGTTYTPLCMSHIENFANVGLRTLVAACRVIPEEMATSWLKDYKAAGNSIQQRAELLSACAKQIEKDMVMLGAIGIEDE
eukprot:gene16667-19009_t